MSDYGNRAQTPAVHSKPSFCTVLLMHGHRVGQVKVLEGYFLQILFTLRDWYRASFCVQTTWATLKHVVILKTKTSQLTGQRDDQKEKTFPCPPTRPNLEKLIKCSGSVKIIASSCASLLNTDYHTLTNPTKICRLVNLLKGKSCHRLLKYCLTFFLFKLTIKYGN